VSDTAFDRHDWVGLAIVILAFGNAVAALVHHFVLKYQVLERTLIRRRSNMRAQRDCRMSPCA
jgi:cytochrome b561